MKNYSKITENKDILTKEHADSKYAKINDIPTSTTVSNWGFTKNIGTITGIKMNNVSKGTSGVVDLGTVLTAHQDISGKANLSGGNTFSGLQTVNAPANSNGIEQATAKFKTANGGSITFGKEGSNSGTMIRLDQKDGTCRLRFRSSATAGAMVWEQPEQGSCLYYDVSGVQFRGCTSVLFNNFKSAGYLYTDSSGSLKKGNSLAKVATTGSYTDLSNTPTIPTVNNGTLTIKQNGTTVQTFSANQSGNVTANITVPTFSFSNGVLTITT